MKAIPSPCKIVDQAHVKVFSNDRGIQSNVFNSKLTLSFQSWPPVKAKVPNADIAENVNIVTKGRNGIIRGFDEMLPWSLKQAIMLKKKVQMKCLESAVSFNVFSMQSNCPIKIQLTCLPVKVIIPIMIDKTNAIAWTQSMALVCSAMTCPPRTKFLAFGSK